MYCLERENTVNTTDAKFKLQNKFLSANFKSHHLSEKLINMEKKTNVCEDLGLLDALVLRENLEKKALANITSETLKELHVSIDALPQKYQNMLQQVAKNQQALGMEQLDPISLTLLSSRGQCDMLEDEYEILKLKQKSEMLQEKIERNKKFINEIKEDLQSSKKSLASQNPNPENIQDYTRQLKMKLASYEDSCEKAENKLTDLAVPDAILPKSLTSLMTTLASLRDEAAALKQRADDVTLVREARDTFSRLRR